MAALPEHPPAMVTLYVLLEYQVELLDLKLEKQIQKQKLQDKNEVLPTREVM